MNPSRADQIALGYEAIVQRFIGWAQTQDEIRSAMVLGSRARTDHPADEFSDLDLSIFVEKPHRYLESTQWLEHIGTPWLTFVEQTSDGRHWERRCLFEGGLDVDFAFVPAALVSELVEMGAPPEIEDIFRRGVRILFDKDNQLAQVAFESPPQGNRPRVEETAFLEVVNDFWYHCVWTAKHLRRGELWWAKGCCDGHLKELLRRMLEWHTQAQNGPGKDTWLRGRFLEEWADRRAVAALKEAFAYYQVDDVWRALFSTMHLFSWVSRETGALNHFNYPENGAVRASEFVRQLYDQRE